MRLRPVDAAVALLAALLLGYALVALRQPLFGLAAAATVTMPYAAWRGGETERGAVLFGLWAVLAATLWVGRLDAVLPAAGATAVAYLGWRTLRGGGHAPLP